jgi:hypothetical protein
VALELDPEIPGIEAPGQDARASTLRKEANHLKQVLAEKALEVDFCRSASFSFSLLFSGLNFG